MAACICVGQASAQIGPFDDQSLQPSDEQQHNIIHGSVVNALTHEPIGRALVHSTDDKFATLTDGEGHFEFTLPKAEAETGDGFVSQGQARPVQVHSNTLWLVAHKPGFLDDPNGTNQIAATPGSEVTISLIPEALIQGRVTLSTNDAATGITVQLFIKRVQEGMPRWMPAATARANSSGEFRFAELQPGAYKLVTHELLDNDPVTTVPGGQLYGFPPAYYPNVTDFAAAGTIQLTAGQTFQADLSLARQPYYPVSIPVTNAESNSGMRITVSPRGRRGPGYSLSYNGAKQRIEGALPNGSYLVEAATFGQNSSTGQASIAVSSAPVEGAAMVLTRNSSIIVNAKEEFTSTESNPTGSWSDGKRTLSLHGPRLYLYIRAEPADDFAEQRGGGSLRPPVGPDDESIVLENLAPGRYWLRIRTGYGYVASATMGGVDLMHQPVVIGLGSSVPIDITIRDDSAEIEGTIAGVTSVAPAAEGEIPPPAPPAHIYCVPLADSPGQFFEIPASSDGKFDHQNAAPGAYRLLAFKNRQPNLPYRDPESMQVYEAKGQTVHLSSGQKATVQLQIISSE
ncbi:MAG: hypothetical protein ABSA78_01785 [Candidatus Sulfotelmatobacter sp.]